MKLELLVATYGQHFLGVLSHFLAHLLIQHQCSWQ